MVSRKDKTVNKQRVLLKIVLCALPLLYNCLLTTEALSDISTGQFDIKYLTQGNGDKAVLGDNVLIKILESDEEGKPVSNDEDYLLSGNYIIGIDEELSDWNELLLNLHQGDKVLVSKSDKHYRVELLEIHTLTETRIYDIPNKAKITTETGLEYIIINTGGGKKAAPGYTVVFHFIGYLEDLSVFVSSYDDREPVKLILGIDEMIPGWFEGLCLMREGEEMRLIIPPELAFGEEGIPDLVPPDSTVIFDIELLEVY